MYLSTHQWPFYPGTGAAAEVGRGAGVGATVNVPLPAGCGDADYAAAWHEVIAPALRRHQPELLLVSGGFDAFADDPLAEMKVSVGGFGYLASQVCALADELCHGRVVCVLEGGYDLAGLGASVAAVFEAFAAPDPAQPAAAHRFGEAVAGRRAIDAALAAQAAVAPREVG
jgi:acetoin utilization deacetylase AcuC-like enzyme